MQICRSREFYEYSYTKRRLTFQRSRLGWMDGKSSVFSFVLSSSTEEEEILGRFSYEPTQLQNPFILQVCPRVSFQEPTTSSRGHSFSIHSFLDSSTISRLSNVKRGICKYEIVLDIFVGVERGGGGELSRLFETRARENKLRFSGALVLRRFSTATGSRTIMGKGGAVEESSALVAIKLLSRGGHRVPPSPSCTPRPS